MLDSIFPISDFNSEFYDCLCEETEGNPLFILEMLEYLRSEYIIEPDSIGIWNATQPLFNLDIPDGISNIISKRLENLTPDQHKLLEGAAVEGDEFTPAILSYVTGIHGTPLFQILGELEHIHRLILPLGAQRRGEAVFQSKNRYQFDHKKIRDVLYQDIPFEQRKKYHLRIADYFEQYSEEHPEAIPYALAHHYHLSGDLEKAFEYMVKSAQRDEGLYSNERAVKYYKISLDILEKLDTISDKEKQQVEILNKIAWIRTHITAELDEALEIYHKILLIGQNANYQADALKEAGNIHSIRGEWELAERAYKESMELHNQLGELGDVAAINLSIGANNFERGNLDEAMNFCDDALKTAKEINDVSLQASSYSLMGVIHSVRKDWENALDCYQKAIEEYEQIGEDRKIAHINMNLANVYADMKCPDEADKYYAQSEESARKCGDERFLGFILMNRAELKVGAKQRLGLSAKRIETNVLRPDAKAAKELCDEALSIMRSIYDKPGIAEIYRVYGLIYCELEEWDLAESFFKNSMSTHEESNSNLGMAEIHREMGQMYQKRQMYTEALKCFQQAHQSFQELGMSDEAQRVREVIAEIENDEKSRVG